MLLLQYGIQRNKNYRMTQQLESFLLFLLVGGEVEVVGGGLEGGVVLLLWARARARASLSFSLPSKGEFMSLSLSWYLTNIN